MCLRLCVGISVGWGGGVHPEPAAKELMQKAAQKRLDEEAGALVPLERQEDGMVSGDDDDEGREAVPGSEVVLASDEDTTEHHQSPPAAAATPSLVHQQY